MDSSLLGPEVIATNAEAVAPFVTGLTAANYALNLYQVVNGARTDGWAGFSYAMIDACVTTVLARGGWYGAGGAVAYNAIGGSKTIGKSSTWPGSWRPCRRSPCSVRWNQSEGWI
ncbi:hypothetical protein [Peristeroidobacter soli]|uniref:hypothetical protein n=1 Tax=Peristeroidobacter soli TaxID=2497877 RepID=UPI00101BBA3A|nr:hypothetical protein [Peristeroidobacter soli]